MKITFSEEKQIKPLNEVKTGTVFLYENKVYMKLGQYTDLPYNTIRMMDGAFEKLSIHSEVEILDCELIIKGR